MDNKNKQKILSILKDTDKVLDIGGGAEPFERADYILDIIDYDERVKKDNENFTKETWIKRDVCEREPFPFKDNEFDFVVCSHLLEDIRDPLWVCSEMNRISKKGYIEVPSREVESIKNLELKGYTGYCHHRWLVEIINNKIYFAFKNNLILSNWKYHLPKRFKPNKKIDFLFWEDSFDYKEIFNIYDGEIRKFLGDFVKERKAYPKYKYLISNLSDFLKDISRPTRKILKNQSTIMTFLHYGFPSFRTDEILVEDGEIKKDPRVWSDEDVGLVGRLG